MIGKKLKRRLEDLERRAGSSSASPEQQHAEIFPSQNPRGSDPTKKRRASKPGVNPPRASRSPVAPPTPSFSVREDQSSMFSRQYTRQLSASPPPAFTYSQFPVTEPPPIQAPYPQHAPFHTLPAPYPDFQSQPLYLPPLPMTRPNGNSYDGAPVKPESNFNDDEMISHFNMSYSSISGIEVPTTQSYADSNAYVNNPEYSFQLPYFLLNCPISFVHRWKGLWSRLVLFPALSLQQAPSILRYALLTFSSADATAFALQFIRPLQGNIAFRAVDDVSTNTTSIHAYVASLGCRMLSTVSALTRVWTLLYMVLAA